MTERVDLQDVNSLKLKELAKAETDQGMNWKIRVFCINPCLPTSNEHMQYFQIKTHNRERWVSIEAINTNRVLKIGISGNLISSAVIEEICHYQNYYLQKF